MRTNVLTGLAAVALAVLMTPGSSGAQDDFSADLRLIARSQYVAFGVDVGSAIVAEMDISDSRVLAEEREALLRIRRKFESWKRFKLVDRPALAEVTIVVRSGRRVSANVVAGGRGRSTPTGNWGGGGQVSTPDDMLTAYAGRGGSPGSVLWRAQATTSQFDSWEPLFEQFKKAVESVGKQD